MPFSSFIRSAAEHVATRVQEYAAEQQHLRNNNAMQPPDPMRTPASTTAYHDQGYAIPPYDSGFRSDQNFSWGRLLNQDKTASPTYQRLLQAIFNYANQSCHPMNTNGLEPAKLAWVHDQLGTKLEDNTARASLQIAARIAHPSPESFRNQLLTMYYSSYGLAYVMPYNDGTPVLTREGFIAHMVSDTLINPTLQRERLNRILSNHHTALIDPATNLPFPRHAISIPRNSLSWMPDMTELRQVASRKAAFEAQFFPYLQQCSQSHQNVQSQGYHCTLPNGTPQQSLAALQATANNNNEYWTMMRMGQNYLHNSTMDALTPGYVTYDGKFHNTGGLQW